MDSQNYSEGRKVTIKRTLNAPIKLVWEAWSQPEHIAQWWGPKGMEVTVLEHDFREGGNWKYTMQMPDGSEFLSEGTFIEIKHYVKIISSANFRPMTEGVEIQSHFSDIGEKTEFTFIILHPTEEYRIQQEKMGIYNGWGSVFDRLSEFLESTPQTI